jgi:hypothetical protein
MLPCDDDRGRPAREASPEATDDESFDRGEHQSAAPAGSFE